MDAKILQIGNVDLDLRQYSGSDQYSDGDIEEELLKIVKGTEDYDAVLSQCEEFAIYYHLAKEREFITDVMDISKQDEVLEIGAGCGAVTGALAEQAKHVHCIDLSKEGHSSMHTDIRSVETSAFRCAIMRIRYIRRNMMLSR